jgi:hypothetical protein
MKTVSTPVLGLLLLAGSSVPALAQGLPDTQPAFLRIIREEVKVGRAAEHTKLEAAWPAAFERAKSPDYYLAMDSLTNNEAWFVIPAASYAAMGESMAREQDPAIRGELDRLRLADADLITAVHSIELRARPDLSSGAYPDVGKQRFWEITMFKMRPGGSSAFAGMAKLYGSASGRAGRTIGYRVYEVTAGMPTPSYFVFSSVAAFADFDKLLTEDEATLKATTPADGDAVKAFEEKLTEAQTFRMQLSPEMSYVPQQVRAADPGFWMPAKTIAPKAKPATAKPTSSTQR